MWSLQKNQFPIQRSKFRSDLDSQKLKKHERQPMNQILKGGGYSCVKIAPKYAFNSPEVFTHVKPKR